MTSRIPTRNEQIVIPPGYEHIVEPRQYHLVENTWKEWNRAVRDFLGGETGFVLSHKGRMHNIHISTTNYISPKFGYIVGLVGMENWLLGQKSALLAGLLSGTNDLSDFFDRNPNSREQLDLTDQDIESAPRFAETLTKIIEKLPHWQIDILRCFKTVEERILGRYHVSSRHVELHWIPIAIVADCLKVSIKDLTLVVLIHELAHAYTHCGMDIDGGYTPTNTTVKLAEFKSPSGQKIYLVTSPSRLSSIKLMVHPGLKRHALSELAGVESVSAEHRFHSNMTQFPKRLNKGVTETAYGWQVSVSTIADLRRFLSAFTALDF